MKKLITIVVAVLLIALIGWLSFGTDVLDRFSYSKETVDLKEYFNISGEQAAIIMQNNMLEDKALVKNDIFYLPIGIVHSFFSESFYADVAESLLLYTTPTQIFRVGFGDSVVWDGSEGKDLGYAPAYFENEVVYIAVDFIKQYVNFSFETYEHHIQIDTEWDVAQLATIKKKTALRVLGGVKSPIVREVASDEQVEILEQMDNWSKVKTSDSLIGYIENKFLTDKTTEVETPVTEIEPLEYTSLSLEGKVSLGWHAIGGVGGNDTLDSMVSGATGLNVVAPTWFSLNDNEGNFRSHASQSYVEAAHAKGLQVWGVWDDFNYNLENDAGISVYTVLSSTTKRQYLVENIINTALDLGLDGINIDFERIGDESGPHFIQFLRELSIQCRNHGFILSTDNYVPFNFNNYYRLDIQGQIVDYVIIMGYDEHWSGGGTPGSVASIEYVKGGILKTMESVPAQKVVNALPFYTIVWKSEGAEVSDEYLTLRNTDDFIKRTGLTPEWDEETCQNYLEWDEDGIMYQVWIEDEQSIGVKLNVMTAQNIGGVAVWRLGYGTPEVWNLIDSYVKR